MKSADLNGLGHMEEEKFLRKDEFLVGHITRIFHHLFSGSFEYRFSNIADKQIFTNSGGAY